MNKIKKHQMQQYIIYGMVGVLSVVGIFLLLIVTGRGDTDKECKKLGFSGSTFFGDTCKVEDEYVRDNIAIVVGNTANSPLPELSKRLKKYISSSVTKNSPLEIDIISANTGTGKIKTYVADLETDGGFESYANEIQRINSEIEQLMQIAPVSDGVDYLNAIINAGDALSWDDEGEKRPVLLVFGSGLSDEGILNFADGNLFEMSNDEIIQKMKEVGVKQYKFDIDIVWSGYGQTTSPQEQLLLSYQTKVKDIYNEVLRMFVLKNGGSIKFDGSLPTHTKSVETNKLVRSVAVDNIIIWGGTFGDKSSLSFKKDTAIFAKSDNEIINELHDLIEKSNSNLSGVIYITGYVALVECGGDRDVELAQKRADATKDFLVKKVGIKNKIISKGSADAIVDECQDGYINDDLRSENRVVSIELRKG